ncbi:hypothetical protein TNCV_4623091 [Trichonephila clavipes]|nr:hypothetical protein TNCV_4623091 [Trichonephila clavipes]
MKTSSRFFPKEITPTIAFEVKPGLIRKHNSPPLISHPVNVLTCAYCKSSRLWREVSGAQMWVITHFNMELVQRGNESTNKDCSSTSTNASSSKIKMPVVFDEKMAEYESKPLTGKIIMDIEVL